MSGNSLTIDEEHRESGGGNGDDVDRGEPGERPEKQDKITKKRREAKGKRTEEEEPGSIESMSDELICKPDEFSENEFWRKNVE